MARIFVTTTLIVITSILAGCQQPNEGRAQLLPLRTKYPPASVRAAVASRAAEADIVEQVAVNRESYRNGLKSLIQYYKRAGNHMKLQWAQKELKALDLIPQYRYIIQAEVAGPGLKATTAIPEADELYYNAVMSYKNTRDLLVLVNNDRMRMALDKFNQLIQRYPTSDKIDDAAFKAGEIYRYFKDYAIALLYYQRTYQWDENTIYPARYRAGRILDTHLGQRDEALKLYQQSLEKEKLSNQQREFAEQRIQELTEEEPAK